MSAFDRGFWNNALTASIMERSIRESCQLVRKKTRRNNDTWKEVRVRIDIESMGHLTQDHCEDKLIIELGLL
jgi:predicted NAD-dependent protein-ADP-ribosyltransferase YbiA (DUF1768 family)